MLLVIQDDILFFLNLSPSIGPAISTKQIIVIHFDGQNQSSISYNQQA